MCWLFGEPGSDAVFAALARAEAVVTSDLTMVECDRALIRAQLISGQAQREAARRREILATASNHWTLLRIAPAILDRARQPFPGEPIRTLDALHLASALAATGTLEDLRVLSLDRRIRSSALALGLSVLPAE
jgi:predicted nucleic acid-binding protein